MTTFLQFRFTKEDMLSLFEQNADLVIVNVAYELVDDKDGIKRAALAASADGIKSGSAQPVATVAGCPLPPCTVN